MASTYDRKLYIRRKEEQFDCHKRRKVWMHFSRIFTQLENQHTAIMYRHNKTVKKEVFLPGLYCCHNSHQQSTAHSNYIDNYIKKNKDHHIFARLLLLKTSFSARRTIGWLNTYLLYCTYIDNLERGGWSLGAFIRRTLASSSSFFTHLFARV